MNLPSERYVDQQPRWPQSGRHILAHFDDQTIVVYQAYSADIGHHAVANQRFGGGFSYRRMSWIKPNFLWMMYRSNWGQAESQEVVLAIRLKRSFFDELLDVAVPSSFWPQAYASREVWSKAVATSDVRLQWDPDHLPTGEPIERRAIQLGLRGRVLEVYGQREIIDLTDISGFVAEQREHAFAAVNRLFTPIERVYLPSNQRTASRIGLFSAHG